MFENVRKKEISEVLLTKCSSAENNFDTAASFHRMLEFYLY